VIGRGEYEATNAVLPRRMDDIKRHVKGRARIVPGCIGIGILSREVHRRVNSPEGTPPSPILQICEIRDPKIDAIVPLRWVVPELGPVDAYYALAPGPCQEMSN